MRRYRVGSKRVRLAVMILFPLLWGAAPWASELIFTQKHPGDRWNPRKVPANAEFVGDQVCAECHKKKVVSHAQSGMATAMETFAASKVLTANPNLKFRVGPYSYEITRQGKQSMFTVTDERETISLPILYA